MAMTNEQVLACMEVKQQQDTITILVESLEKTVVSLEIKIDQIINERILENLPVEKMSATAINREPMSVKKIDNIITALSELISKVNYITKEKLEAIYQDLSKL